MEHSRRNCTKTNTSRTYTHTHYTLSFSQMINQGTRSYRVTELRAAGGWGASEMQGFFLKASRKSHKECFKSRNEMTSPRKGIGKNINQRAESHTANSNCSSESKSSFRVHKPKNCCENRGFFFCHIQWQLHSTVMSPVATEASYRLNYHRLGTPRSLRAYFINNAKMLRMSLVTGNR